MMCFGTHIIGLYILTINGLQMDKQCDGLCQQFGRWSIHEVERVQVLDAALLHTQNNVGQIGMSNFGVHRLHLFKVVLRVEPETFSRSGSSSTTGPLDSGSLADRLDQQGLDASDWIELFALAEARVDDENDVLDCLLD